MKTRPTGESIDDVLDRFQFPSMAPKVPCAPHLQRKEDVFVDRARDARYDGSALVTAFDSGAFALLPIVVDDKVAGCLYAELPRAPANSMW